MTEQNVYQSPKRNKIPAAGIVIALLVIGAVLSLNYFKLTPHLAQLTPRVSPKPSAAKPALSQITVPVLTFPGCDIKKEGNPLVQQVRPVGDITLATLYGNIDKIANTNQTNTAATITMLSTMGSQSYTFEISDEPGLVYDSANLKNLKLVDLKQGQTIMVSINCFPKKNNSIKIAQIAIINKK